MNKNKIIKKILIIFILIIIGILAPGFARADSDREITSFPVDVTYDEKFYAWGANTENAWGTGASNWVIVDSLTDGGIEILASSSNDQYLDDEIYVSVDEIVKNWFLLCCQLDTGLGSDEDLVNYLGQRACYTKSSSYVGNPMEAYLLSNLEAGYGSPSHFSSDNAYQRAWWYDYVRIRGSSRDSVAGGYNGK